MMKEKIKKLEQWLSEGFAFIKSIAFMKKLVFEEGNVLMRAVIYSFKFFFFAYVIYTVNSFIFQWVDNQFVRDVIFILFLTFAVLISVGSLMLDVDEMKENHKKEIEQYKNKIKELTAKMEQEIKERDIQIRFFKEKYEHCNIDERKYYQLYEVAKDTIKNMMFVFFHQRYRKKEFGKWVIKPEFRNFQPAYILKEKYDEFMKKNKDIAERYEDYRKNLELQREIENLKSF